MRAGTWHIALGPYTVAPQGLAYEITVTLTFGEPGRTPRPVYPPERAKGRGRAWYRGDCHLHSWHSDGRRTPAEIAALARAAGLDFVNSSDHNTSSAHAHWAEAAGDDLLVLLGEEVTTRNGHVVALGTDPGTFVDWRYRARDNRFGRFARQIRRAGGLVVPAHPHATCIGCNWKFGFGEADAVEVWNGPWTPDDEVALADWDGMLVASVREGRDWIPAMGSSDAHRDPDVVGLPQTVVLADDLSRRAIQNGIRAGRAYVAESADVSVAFSASRPAWRTRGDRRAAAGPGRLPVTVRTEVTGAPAAPSASSPTRACCTPRRRWRAGTGSWSGVPPRRTPRTCARRCGTRPPPGRCPEAWPLSPTPSSSAAGRLGATMTTRAERRYRVVTAFQRRVGNPLLRRMPFQTLLETTGRVSGLPRTTPVGGRRVGDTFWLVSEFGERSQYVRNIAADPGCGCASGAAGTPAPPVRCPTTTRSPGCAPSPAQQRRRTGGRGRTAHGTGGSGRMRSQMWGVRGGPSIPV